MGLQPMKVLPSVRVLCKACRAQMVDCSPHLKVQRIQRFSSISTTKEKQPQITNIRLRIKDVLPLKPRVVMMVKTTSMREFPLPARICLKLLRDPVTLRGQVETYLCSREATRVLKRRGNIQSLPKSGEIGRMSRKRDTRACLLRLMRDG